MARKRRPRPWDFADFDTARAVITSAVCNRRYVALGIDPGSRGCGIAVCEFTRRGKLLAAVALSLSRDAHEACRQLVKLFVEIGSMYRGEGVRLVGIEKQPGVAKRAVVRTEGWLFAAAMAHCPTVLYVQPKRHTESFGFSARDEKIIGTIQPPALREHGRSALWMVRQGLANYFQK